MSSATIASRPMEGLRIIELSNMVTASLPTMMFAQQGADIIKVEPPTIGDLLRHFGSQKNGISGFFNNCNRGKRSIAVDLKTEQGVDIVRRLSAEADVLIHNYRPGVMDKLGLGSEALRTVNPRLVYMAISGFGTQGPMADAPAYDHVVQALSGITAAQGAGDDFEYVRMTMCDKITGYTAGQAITAALLMRARTGEGQHIDLSMLEACIAFMWPDGMMHKTLLAEDALHVAPMASYYKLLQVRDGQISFAAASDAHWQNLFKIIGRADLCEDPRFASMKARSENADDMIAEVNARGVDKDCVTILAELSAADVPCAPCTSLDDLAEHPQIKANAIIEELDHPLLGPVRMAAAPARFGGQQATQIGPSPALGQHSVEILVDCGWSETEIAAFKTAKVI